jgi:hypothetical protein
MPPAKANLDAASSCLKCTIARVVTDADRKARARSIAETLGKPERWHSHGRGIGLKELVSEEIKLKVIDFGTIPELNDRIRGYYDLFIDYCKKMGVNTTTHTVLHSSKGVKRF